MKRVCSEIIISNRNKFLVLERNPKRYKGWGFVKGGVDEGETIQDAAAREIFEEIGIVIDKSKLKPLEIITVYFDPKKDRQVEVHWFYINIEHKLLRLEQDEWISYKWLDKDKIATMLRWDSDRDIYEQFLASYEE